MRLWKVVLSDENDMLSEKIMSDGDIISEYWDEWYKEKRKKYGDSKVREYTSEECIQDFIKIHWATEVISG